jgi:hypothetical protein
MTIFRYQVSQQLCIGLIETRFIDILRERLPESSGISVWFNRIISDLKNSLSATRMKLASAFKLAEEL